MSYSINQFNGINKNYMTLLSSDSSIDHARVNNDDYFYYPSLFNSQKTYFMHCWIRNELFLQKIKVKLCSISDGVVSEVYQNLKYVEYNVAEVRGWKEMILVFKPVSDDFNTILFELTNRTADSQHTNLIYEELSELKNTISEEFAGITVLKLGIRSSANSIYSINDEYINIGKSGVMEFNQNDTRIFQICPIMPASENNSALDNAKTTMLNQSDTSCISTSLISNSKTRAGVNFVLDYIYEE